MALFLGPLIAGAATSLLFGGKNDSKTLNKTLNETIVETTTEFAQNNDQTVENKIDSSQSMEVKMGKVMFGGKCKIKILNAADISQMTDITTLSKQSAELQKKIVNETVNYFEAEKKQSNKFPWGKNVSDTTNDITNRVVDITNTVFSESNIQKSVQSIISIQDNKVTMGDLVCPPGSKSELEIGNEFLAKQVATVLSEQFQESVQKDEVLHRIDNTFKEKLSQLNTMSLAASGCCVICCIACVIMLIMGGKAASKAASNVAQSPAGQNAIRARAG